MASEVAIENEIIAEGVETDQYLVFIIQSQEFGFQAMRVQEISQVLAVTQVPNAPPYIDGIMNLRGRIATVVNFRKKFGFGPKEHDEDTRVIVVELGDSPIGIIVDSVEEVIKIPDESVQKLPESTGSGGAREYMTGIGVMENRLVILLDVEKVLTGTEMLEEGALARAADAVQATEAPGPEEAVGANNAEVTEPAAENAVSVEEMEASEVKVDNTAPDKPTTDAGKKRQKRGTE